MYFIDLLFLHGVKLTSHKCVAFEVIKPLPLYCITTTSKQFGYQYKELLIQGL